MEKGIFIDNPSVNSENFRDFSRTNPTLSLRRFNEFCQKTHISPITHPKACDLFAGLGAMSQILTNNGWQDKNITCIDRTKPDQPLVPKANWLFWDLKVLAKAVMSERSLPDDVLKHKGKFDVVVMAYGSLPSDWELLLVEFFVKDKKNTLIIPNEDDWKRVFIGR